VLRADEDITAAAAEELVEIWDEVWSWRRSVYLASPAGQHPACPGPAGVRALSRRSACDVIAGRHLPPGQVHGRTAYSWLQHHASRPRPGCPALTALGTTPGRLRR
jgi:hypothetical protein